MPKGQQVTKPIKDMIAEANEEIEVGDVITQEDQPDAVLVTTSTADPLQRGLDALRARELEPLRIWSVKGPKGVGGLVCAVFLQATSEIVLMHQLPSGKFTVFTKAEVGDLSVEDQ